MNSSFELSCRLIDETRFVTPKSSYLFQIWWRQNRNLWHSDLGKKNLWHQKTPKVPDLCPGFWTQKSWVLTGIFDMFHVTNLFWHYVIYEQSLIYIQIVCLISTTIMSYSWKDSFLWYAVLTWLLRDSPLEGDHCKLLQPGTLHLPILDNTCFHRSHISFGNKTPFNFTKKI